MARLDQCSAGVRWNVHPDGVLGRALLMPVGTTFTVPLRLANEVSFSARAMLLPHDWRDGRDAVRVTAMITDANGHRAEMWSALLRASDRGRPRGRRVEFKIPLSTTALQLNVEAQRTLRPRSVGRAIWVEPTIVDPHAPPILRPSAGSGPPLELSSPTDRPLISVLTPVHDPPLEMLEEAIASVRGQTFADWELCLVDDGSTKPEIIAALEHHAAADPRIHLRRRDQAGGISTATNTALELATGQYIALLDHDDTLTTDALQQVADQIAAQPDLDMIYSDEEVVDDQGRIGRNSKPGWSPEHMSVLMYTNHLGVYRRALALELGGFRSQFDGCQDYDFVLRLTERTDRVAHIPRVLYHWRAHANSTAGGSAKPYAYLAQPGAIAEHLRRTGVDAEVQFGHLPGLHRVVHQVQRSTCVDLVLAVDSDDGLFEAARSWLAQPHTSWNVVLAAPTPTLRSATARLADAGIHEARITTIATDPGADLVSALADAANAATAEHMLLMQAPAMGLTNDWLTRLIGYSDQHDIAAAGPIVLSADGRIQQAGIALPEGVPLYLQYGDPGAASPAVARNVIAVSGVLAARRDTYHLRGGIDPHFEGLALVEYCLRANQKNRRIVIVPDARLRITGPDRTTNDLSSIWRLRRSWAEICTDDPYYNPNYRTDRGDAITRRNG